MAEILVLVIASDKDPWRTIVELGQRPTWVSKKVPGVTVLFCFGEEGVLPHLCEDCMYVPSPEGTMNIGRKTLAAFKFALASFPFTHIYRTNVSSYVHLAGLKAFLDKSPTYNHYSGVIASHKGIPFISGSGYALSRDLVQKAVDLEDKWDHNLLDDVALGKVLASYTDVRLTQCPRINVYNKRTLRLVNSSSTKTTFHFRCKSDGDRNFDILAMHYIHKFYNQ